MSTAMTERVVFQRVGEYPGLRVVRLPIDPKPGLSTTAILGRGLWAALVFGLVLAAIAGSFA